MNHYFTRTVSLVLAFGFFFIASCSSQLHTLEDVRKEYKDGNYERSLSAVNQLLQEEPQNAQLLFLKAEVLKNLALEQPQPVNRTSYYREMRSTLDAMETLEDSEWLSKRDPLVLEVWILEQNAAVQLLENHTSESSGQIEPAIAHFDNALAINPDSSRTYNLKASAFYRDNDLKNAVHTLLEADNRFDPMPLEMQEKLAFLLLEEGQLKTSIEHYQAMLDRQPESEEIRHGLVNAYILDDQHEKSIELLNELLDADPDNYLYHQSLATELFFHIQNSVAGMNSEDIDDEVIIDRHEELMRDLEKAEEHYQYVKDNHPNPEEFTFVTAAFYKNTANHLIKLADTRDNELSERLYEKAHDLLERSVPVWKAVAERNPENPEIWRSMYQIYSELNMEEEAEEALSNTN